MKIYQQFLILFLRMIPIYSAPLQLQYQSQLSLQPTQEDLLQQQLLALQQLQNLQLMNELNNYYPQTMQNQASPPMMIIFPDSQNQDWTQTNNEHYNENNFLTKNSKVNDKETDDKDSDSIVVEAQLQSEPTPEPEPKKAILLIPNTRTFSIGGIISAIPFLPIEINVPDTVSWIYGGISNIIGGIIGQRLPVKKPVPTPTSEQDNNVKLLIKRLRNRNQNVQMPILMLPDVAQMYPMPMPMQL